MNVGSRDVAAFRTVVDTFYRDEVVPEYPEWEGAGAPPRRFWERAGELGMLSIGFPAEYDGGRTRDFSYNVALTESAQHFGLALGGLRVQTDIVLPYLLRYGNEAQLATWLPRMAAGKAICALAITEPGTGSDMKAMRTTAERASDGYIVNGAKTFISNGTTADLVILAARTNPDAGRDGLSLLLVDTAAPGFVHGQRLHKLGLHAQDLGEFALTDMYLPASALLGEEGAGFRYLTSNLAQERLSIAVNAQASAAAVLATTVEHFAGRKNSQDVKFTLATCQARTVAGQAMLDRAVEAHLNGELSPEAASAVKLYCTENQFEVADRCLQLAGLSAYTRSSRIARAYLDARAGRIYAGSSEVMRIMIAKSLGV